MTSSVIQYSVSLSYYEHNIVGRYYKYSTALRCHLKYDLLTEDNSYIGNC